MCAALREQEHEIKCSACQTACRIYFFCPKNNFSSAPVPPDLYTRAHTDDFEVLQTRELIYCRQHQHLWLTDLQRTVFTDLHFSFPLPINNLNKTRTGHISERGFRRFYTPSQGSAKFSCALERERVFHQSLIKEATSCRSS